MSRLASLPLVLQVAKSSPWKTARSLLAQKRIEEPLICLDAESTVVKRFLRESKKRGVTWTNVTEATSLDLVSRYVAHGDGIGLNVRLGKKTPAKGIRELALTGYSPLTMGALWRKPASEVTLSIVEHTRAIARLKWPDAVHAES
jgi:DNA-binding transcriptional LysR family regulator